MIADLAPLSDLAQQLSERSIRAPDLAEAALAAQRLDAYRTIDPDRTRAMAHAAEAAFAVGARTGPLQGIPASVKDLYGVEGWPTYGGTAQRLPPRFEAPGALIDRLVSQLGVVTGKTHTVEFAFGGIGTNPHTPTPINPWDPTRVPGGSSAGAGVSLQEGSALIALGTDTAGSVRIPAAWTGTVGLKITAGRWPTSGIVPLSTTLDTPGILARTVSDAAFAFFALDRRAGGRDGANDGQAGPRRPGLPIDLARIRVGEIEQPAYDGASPGVAEAVQAALGELPCRRVRLDLPVVADAVALFGEGGPVAAELDALLSVELPGRSDALDPNVAARVASAGELPVREYLRRRHRLQELARRAAAALQEVDVVAIPTVANTPPLIADLADPDVYRAQNLLCLRNTAIASYLGLCALSLPCGLDAQGMPVGLQLIAPRRAGGALARDRRVRRARAGHLPPAPGNAAPRSRLGPPPGGPMSIVQRPPLDAPIEDWQVYADALQTDNDPLGELIMMDIAGDEAARRTHLDRHAAAIFGPLAPHRDKLDIAWRYCVPATASLHVDPGDDPAALVRALLDAPIAAAMPRLRLVARTAGARPVDLAPGIALLAEGLSQATTALELADDRAKRSQILVSSDYTPGTNLVSFGSLDAVWAIRHLEALRIDVADVEQLSLGTIDAPALADFALIGLRWPYAYEDASDTAKALAAARWPALDRLSLRLPETITYSWPDQEGAYIAQERYDEPNDYYEDEDGWGGEVNWGDELGPLLESLRNTPLTQLSLTSFANSRPLLEALVASGLLSQLSRLDLSGSDLDDDDVAWMLEQRAAFAKLDHLDLNGTPLSRSDDLATLGPQIAFSPGGGHGYEFSVGME